MSELASHRNKALVFKIEDESYDPKTGPAFNLAVSTLAMPDHYPFDKLCRVLE